MWRWTEPALRLSMIAIRQSGRTISPVSSSASLATFPPRHPDLAKPGRIPPAAIGTLNHQDLIALVERDHAASRGRRNVTVVTVAHLGAPAPQKIAGTPRDSHRRAPRASWPPRTTAPRSARRRSPGD